MEKGSNFAQCTACAIKVLSHSVAARARSGADPKPHEDQRICSLLLRTIKKVGDVYEVCNGNEDESFEDTECAAVRLAAASAVLRISRSLGKKAFHVLSPNDYLMTALTAQDANPDVRLTFARKIYTGILHKKLQLRWVVGLILMAIDPDRQNMESVKKYTATLVKIWKMKVEDFKRTEKTEDIRSILPLLPECVLPSVVWILAHHPDIKLDADSGFPETKKYLEFFFSRLLAQTDYASFLVQILQVCHFSLNGKEDKDEGWSLSVCMCVCVGAFLSKFCLHFPTPSFLLAWGGGCRRLRLLMMRRIHRQKRRKAIPMRKVGWEQ